MKKRFSYSSLRKAFLLLVFLLFVLNALSFTFFLFSLVTGKKPDPNAFPGYEFSDFKGKLAGVKEAGFLTDKDMSSERNDGQFLAAQYVLAPLILDLDNANHKYLILDCLSPAWANMTLRKINAVVVDTNAYGKILAERR